MRITIIYLFVAFLYFIIFLFAYFSCLLFIKGFRFKYCCYCRRCRCCRRHCFFLLRPYSGAFDYSLVNLYNNPLAGTSWFRVYKKNYIYKHTCAHIFIRLTRWTLDIHIHMTAATTTTTKFCNTKFTLWIRLNRSKSTTKIIVYDYICKSLTYAVLSKLRTK